MKAKTVKGNSSWRSKKFGLPSVFLLCIFFFLAGFFGSSIFDHSQEDEYGVRLMPRPRARLLEKSTEHRLLHAGQSGDNFITSIPFQVLSWNPRALYFPNFASAEQCESIIELARGGLKPSTLALRKGETEENTKGIRTRVVLSLAACGQNGRLRAVLGSTALYILPPVFNISSGVFISASEDGTGILDAIEEKIAKATKIPRTHGEDFNILRYKVGQRYNSHYDAFNPAEYGPQESQRMASFLLYLTDVPEGGETMFPFEDGLNMDGSYGYEDCVGLKVKPRKGDGLLFYSLFPNGTIDLTSLHGSCPVIKGEKWVATKWIRDREQNDEMNSTSN